MLAGWSSGSKYPLLGSVRASAQMVSYEAALGLSLAAVILVTGTLSTSGIVDDQSEHRATGASSPPAFAPVRHLPHRRHRRAQPPAVRPRRGRAGARRWLQHRVLQHPLRAVLPRRVHEHDHDERRHRHAVLRRPAAGERSAADADTAVPRAVHRHGLVPPQADGVPLRLRVVPGHAAAAALRPADEPRLEAADPGRARLVHAAGRVPHRPGRRLEPLGRAADRRRRAGRLRPCCCRRPTAVSARSREREGAMF